MNNIPAISNEEFRQRVEKTALLMAEEKLDLLLAFSTESEPANVRYYSDYWPSFETAAVLIAPGKNPALLIGPESLTYASGRSKIERIIRLMDFRESSQPNYPDSKLPSWRDIFAEFPARRIGIAGWHMFPQAIYANLVEAAPGAEIVNADAVVRQLMIRKSPAELDCLRAAAKISEQGLRAILSEIKPGLTEVEVAAIGTNAMLRGGAEATGYPVWCCSGSNSNQAISRPTHRKIGTGEIVHVSIGAKVSGYSASIGRPIILGHCPADLQDFIETGCAAENLTISLMLSGAKAADVTRQVHGFIRSRGFGDAILYGPAHGCGQMECEYPFVEANTPLVFEKDMTFMVDIFLAQNSRGFRFEDGVIVGDDVAEELSGYRREFIVID
jgi:Xaa-Pro aminopeptidase